MNKKFITVDENGKVMFIHYMPFDKKEGLGKTEAELEQIGFLLDKLPEPEQLDGKMSIPYYTVEKGFWYEYVDIQPTEYQQGYDQAVLDCIEGGIL